MQILCYFFKKSKKYSFYEHILQTNVTITILKFKKNNDFDSSFIVPFDCYKDIKNK